MMQESSEKVAFSLPIFALIQNKGVGLSPLVLNDGESRVVPLFQTAQAGEAFKARFKATGDYVVNVGGIPSVLAFLEDLQGMNVHWVTLNPVKKEDTLDRLSIAELIEVLEQPDPRGEPGLN